MAVLAALAALPAQSQVFNKNLVVNGDAEAGQAIASSTSQSKVSVPNWTTVGGFTVGAYDGTGFLQKRDLGPANRGKNFFYGGPGGLVSSASQVVDLSGAATEIDAGLVQFHYSGYLGLTGGSYGNIATINLQVDFQDASGTTLLHAVASGPTEADADMSGVGLLERSVSGSMPPKARKANVTIYLSTGGSGTISSNYAADNVSLVLTTLATNPTFGVNLLVNGDAEAQPVDLGDEKLHLTGWNSNNALEAWKYGDYYKYPQLTDPGPPDRGKYYIACDTYHPCQAYQTFDFSAAKTLADAGKIGFSLSGWLGGGLSSDVNWPDSADVNVTFYDASNKALGAGATIGPVNASDRNGKVGLFQRTASGTVPAGARLARVTITFHGSGDIIYAYVDSLSFTLNVMQVTAVVNAASSQAGPVAGGQFVSLYGQGLGPSPYATGWQKGLGGTRVFFNGVEAWMTLASDGQINVVVPYGVSGKADVTVQYNGKTTDAFPLSVADSGPGIFTWETGPGAAVIVANGAASVNPKTSPVARGGVVAFWATGQGSVTPAGQDGEAISGFKSLALPYKVTIGGVEAPVSFIGLLYTGVVQVNAVVPANAPTGDAEVILTIGTASSRKGVTIPVK